MDDKLTSDRELTLTKHGIMLLMECYPLLVWACFLGIARSSGII